MSTAASNRALLVVIASAVFLSVLTQTFVNVVVPLMQEDFGVSEGEVGWVITGYLLVFAVGIPLYGRVADLYSIRRVFTLGLALLAAGSVVCAVAPGLLVLVAGRVLQGIGAAAIPALSFAAVAKALPAGKRGVAFGLISSSVGVGASIGPPLGGFIAGISGWHLLFVFTFALSGALAVAAWFALPDRLPGEDEGGGFDLTGGVLLGLSAGLALFAVTEGQTAGFSSAIVVGSALGSIIAGAIFLRRIRRVDQPFISPALLSNRAFLATSAVGFFTMFANVGTLIVTPLLLTQANGLGPAAVGLALVPGAVAVAVLSPVAGRVSDRVGAPVIVRVGLVVMLASALLNSTVGAGGSPLMVAAAVMLLGTGFSLVNSPNANAASASLSVSESGVGLGIYQMAFFLGGGFGPALAGTLLAYRQGGTIHAVNPAYSLDSPGFSDAFLLLALSLGLALVASVALVKEKGESI